MSTQISLENATAWLYLLDQVSLGVVALELGIFIPDCTVEEIVRLAEPAKLIEYVSSNAGKKNMPKLNGVVKDIVSKVEEPATTANSRPIASESISNSKPASSSKNLRGMNKELVKSLYTLVKQYGFDDVFKAFWVVIEGVSKKNPQKVPMNFKILAYLFSPPGKVIKPEDETD